MAVTTPTKPADPDYVRVRSTATIDSGNNLLDVKALKMHFPLTQGIIFQRQVGAVRAVDGIDFFVEKSETLGLVGESGCGKSTTGRAILQLYKPTAGEVKFDGVELTKLGGEQMRKMRRRMQMIFQDPYASLNPRMTVGNIIGEPLEVHNLAKGRAKTERVQELLKIVELADRIDLYERPLHPYSQALLSAVPIPDPAVETKRKRIILTGDVPSPVNPPSGCRFHTRCWKAQQICSEVDPEFIEHALSTAGLASSGGDVSSGGAHAFSSRPEDRGERLAWFPVVESIGPLPRPRRLHSLAAFARSSTSLARSHRPLVALAWSR